MIIIAIAIATIAIGVTPAWQNFTNRITANTI
jgi:hypothetical protein